MNTNGDVRPEIASKKSIQMTLADPEPDSQFPALDPRGIQSPDLGNVCFGQLGVAVADTERCSLLGSRIAAVVAIRANRQVRRVYAARIVATMHDDHALRDGAAGESVALPMRPIDDPIDNDATAISGVINASSPRPALRRAVSAIPKVRGEHAYYFTRLPIVQIAAAPGVPFRHARREMGRMRRL